MVEENYAVDVYQKGGCSGAVCDRSAWADGVRGAGGDAADRRGT